MHFVCVLTFIIRQNECDTIQQSWYIIMAYNNTLQPKVKLKE